MLVGQNNSPNNSPNNSNLAATSPPLGQSQPPKATAKSKRRKQKRRSKLAAQPQLNPHYPASQVMAIQPGGQIQQITPTKAVKVAPPPKNVSFKMPTAQTSNSASQPLDWQGNSLAHKLDVRQNKSINSFL
jgi:hypothetical protein